MPVAPPRSKVRVEDFLHLLHPKLAPESLLFDEPVEE